MNPTCNVNGRSRGYPRLTDFLDSIRIRLCKAPRTRTGGRPGPGRCGTAGRAPTHNLGKHSAKPASAVPPGGMARDHGPARPPSRGPVASSAAGRSDGREGLPRPRDPAREVTGRKGAARKRRIPVIANRGEAHKGEAEAAGVATSAVRRSLPPRVPAGGSIRGGNARPWPRRTRFVSEAPPPDAPRRWQGYASPAGLRITKTGGIRSPAGNPSQGLYIKLSGVPPVPAVSRRRHHPPLDRPDGRERHPIPAQPYLLGLPDTPLSSENANHAAAPWPCPPRKALGHDSAKLFIPVTAM